MIPVFDGHNDTLLRLVLDPERPFATRADDGHIDVVRAAEGGLAGGLFALFAPPDDTPFDLFVSADAGGDAGGPGVGHVPPSGPIDPNGALRVTLAMFARLRRLEADGLLRVCTGADEIEDARRDDVLAAVPHLEGAEAIVDLGVLESLHALGLRSLGPVWSRPNAFATGVPFAFPGRPDVGPGLTARGRELVRACDRLRIVLDVSHLNEAGFWELLDTSERPVVASHSNAHALCASPRNLTDAQLDALAERDGMVGLNFAVSFLREDGGRDADTPVETMVRHLDHLVRRMGEDRVGLGSDFDGAVVPTAIGDVSGLPVLLDALAAHGWDDVTIRKVAYGNWLALLRRVQED